MLVKFLTKRVALLTALAMAVAFIGNGFSTHLPLGIGLGSFTALYKLRLNSRVLLGVSSSKKMVLKSILVQFLSLFLVFGVLVVAVLVSKLLFAGVAAGLLLVPAVICINAVTERTGLTHNNWGEE